MKLPYEWADIFKSFKELFLYELGRIIFELEHNFIEILAGAKSISYTSY